MRLTIIKTLSNPPLPSLPPIHCASLTPPQAASDDDSNSDSDASEEWGSGSDDSDSDSDSDDEVNLAGLTGRAKWLKTAVVTKVKEVKDKAGRAEARKAEKVSLS